MGNVFHEIHFGICQIPRTEKPGGVVHGIKESDTTECAYTHTYTHTS